MFSSKISVCLPTVLIPIIKLSTSSNILSKEFRPSSILQLICWILTGIVISFDIFLFAKHATDLISSITIGVVGTIYILFLIYLIWKPLDIGSNVINNTSTEDGWMSLPQHDDIDYDLNDNEDSPALSSNSNSRRNHSDDDAEEIYAL
jgi:hypothetical protein